MKKTPLSCIHEKLGAKMVDFAGFYMPVEYTGILKEHLCVRNQVGVFDVSHMGEIWVKGPKAKDYLQRITVNDLSKLYPGKVQYSCFPNGLGGIVDDLIIYQYSTEKYLLVVNASNTQKDWVWMNDNNIEGVELENASDKISQLAIQGPKAFECLKQLTDINIESMPSFTFVETTFAGIEHVIISNTGYTGEKGVEIYFYNDYAEKIWNSIMNAGKPFGIEPIGLGARDTLRLEAGLCLYGNDIDDTTSPLEAGLGWITKISDKPNFIDRDHLVAQQDNGIKRILKGFVLEEKGIPRKGYPIVDNKNNRIGTVTSGSISPILNKGIGMGYVHVNYSKPNSEIFIVIRDKPIKAFIKPFPLYKNEAKTHH